MKKKLLLFVLGILLISVVKAQVPQQLNYQGIARTSSGEPISYQPVTIRVSLIDSAAGGKVAYSETRRAMTNYVGLFNVVIGSPGASDVSGSMANVQWSTG